MATLLHLASRTAVALGFSPGQTAVADALAAQRALSLVCGEQVAVDEHDEAVVAFGATLVRIVDAMPDHVLHEWNGDLDTVRHALTDDAHERARLASLFDACTEGKLEGSDALDSFAHEVVASLVERCRGEQSSSPGTLP